MDTFDLKPDAPAEFRGDFRPIASSVPGLRICEHLPRIALQAHHLTLVRSMTTAGRTLGDHHGDAQYLLTGRRPTTADLAQGTNRRPQPDDWPFIGSVVSYCKPGAAGLPAVVSMPRLQNEFTGYVVPGQFAGRLGPAHEPLRVRGLAHPALRSMLQPRQFTIPACQLPGEVDPGRFQGRRALLQRLENGQRRHDLPGSPAERYRTQQQRAFEMITSQRVKEAFNLDREPETLRARYGDNINGQSALLARRLVEQGVPFVCIHWTTPEYSPLVANWDTHGDNLLHLRRDLLPTFDAMFASLLDDLDQRGLLETTLVVAAGEMGRTPRLADGRTRGTSYGPGRDHWPYCYFALLAGGGAGGGQVYGASDSVGAYPRDRPVLPDDLAATVYHALGLSADQLALTSPDGRRIPFLEEGRPLAVF
jgi:hypothetical protein